MIFLRKNFLSLLFFTALLIISTGAKMSFIVGSQTGFFSLSQCLAPLAGVFAGLFGVLLLFFSKTCLYFAGAKTGSLLLALHVPTLCAGLYSAHAARGNGLSIARWGLLCIPIACMILFCIHPVGSEAIAYSLFWLIPVLTLTLNHNNFFVHALGSTFTAHAVGSVLWLYCGLITNPATWLALIPVVICERLIISSGMTITYHIINGISGLLQKKYAPVARQHSLTVE